MSEVRAAPTTRAVVVGTAIAVAALSNLVVLPVVELDTDAVYSAFEVKGGHDQATLLAEHYPSTQERFLFEFTVGELTSDVTVSVARGMSVTPEYLVGLGDADEVVQLATSPRLDRAHRCNRAAGGWRHPY